MAPPTDRNLTREKTRPCKKAENASVMAQEPGPKHAASVGAWLAVWGQLMDKNCSKGSAGRSLNGGFPQIAVLQARLSLLHWGGPTEPNLSSSAAVPHHVPC